MKEFRTLVLAAGKGVRMKSDLPKVLHPVCGKSMLGHVLDAVTSLGSAKTYVVLGHKNELIKNQLDKNIQVIIQQKLLGTADAVKSAKNHFKNYQGQVLIVCGDTPILQKETLQKLLKKHSEFKAACTILTVINPQPFGYGRIVRDSLNQVVAIREQMDATNQEQQIKEINSGVYCFQAKDLFEAIQSISLNQKKKEFYLTDIISLFVEKGLLVETLVADDFQEILGINTREDLALAESILRKRILRRFMLEGVTIIDPVTTYIDSSVKIGQDTIIRPYSIIEENVTIGSRCKIGPFCHIRSNSVIDDSVELGNFTEVSRSKIGAGTFMKHFSFLGDAVVGEGVNIGAGVVTANFDGKNKNKTVIAEGAFIGSDSILIAPINIGKKAVTGAGSVVTKGTRLPAGSLAVGVPAKIQSQSNVRRK